MREALRTLEVQMVMICSLCFVVQKQPITSSINNEFSNALVLLYKLLNVHHIQFPYVMGS